jgi:capsular polysaccharide biosynthesis protein
MPLAETMALWAQADVVLGPHGAGLTNMAFMRAGGLVLELLPVNQTGAHYHRIAAAAGLQHHYYLLDGERGSRRADGNLDVALRPLAHWLAQRLPQWDDTPGACL